MKTAATLHQSRKAAASLRGYRKIAVTLCQSRKRAVTLHQSRIIVLTSLQFGKTAVTLKYGKTAVASYLSLGKQPSLYFSLKRAVWPSDYLPNVFHDGGHVSGLICFADLLHKLMKARAQWLFKITRIVCVFFRSSLRFCTQLQVHAHTHTCAHTNQESKARLLTPSHLKR